MKNNKICLVVFLIIGTSAGACKKELNVYPTTAEVDGNVITDQQSAKVVLNGVYYRFANVGYDDYGGGKSTLWIDVNADFASAFAGSAVSSETDNIFDYASPLKSQITWNYAYSLVNAANGFIKNITPVNNIPAASRRQMLAEARFLRAFGNADLLLYYAQYNDPTSKYGIILRDTFVTTDDINLPRSDVATAYTSILSDLDAAIDGLPTLNTAVYYANASVAKLLKARVLMNRGAAGDYAQVISLTNDIIANGPFLLEDSLKDIFLTKGFSSREVMLGVQPYPDESYRYIIYQQYALLFASDSLVSLLTDDARNQWVYKYAYNDGNQDSILQLTKYYSGDPTNIVQTPLSTYSYAFRLSEAYLLEAEAITLSGGDLNSAKTLLTTVMSHAGAGPTEKAAAANAATPEALQLEIVKEYLRNFVCENGVDWFAMRRLPFTTVQRLNPAIKDPSMLILAIPSKELDYNNVIQNPGY